MEYTESEDGFQLAGTRQRLLNLIIDTAVFLFVWMIGSFLVGIFGGSDLMDLNATPANGQLSAYGPMIVIILFNWAYYIICEYFFRQTVGKYFTKTKVISTSGENPSMGQILLRTISRSIPFEYLTYLGSVEGWHDTISNTRVIEVEE